MNICKNLIIGMLIFSILISTTVSCKKEESLPVDKSKTEEVVVEKFPWGPVIYALVIVIVKVTEGQYKKTTHPDGTIGDNISISRPLVIDNPDVLRQLEVSVDKIVVQGDYAVHTCVERGEEVKYIILR
jgi:hypothetical protein